MGASFFHKYEAIQHKFYPRAFQNDAKETSHQQLPLVKLNGEKSPSEFHTSDIWEFYRLFIFIKGQGPLVF